MLNMTVVGVLALAMLGLPASIQSPAASSAAPSEKIIVDVQTVNGSGCPAGTATVYPSSDNTSFVVAYSDFLAEAGGKATASDARKNCQINALVHVPQGYTYAVAQADYRGFAYLAPGAKGVQIGHYYFTGSSATTESRHEISGPTSGMWNSTDRTTVSELVYAPCGSDSLFNVNTELRVDPGTSDKSSFITMDSTRGSVKTIFQLTWKRCE